jgi:hypothetical protein
MNRTPSIILFLLSLSLSMCKPAATSVEPLNEPGKLLQDGSSVIFSYGGSELLTLETDIPSSAFTVRELKEERDGKVSHVFTVSSVSGERMTIKGTIRAGKESFACEADRRIEGTQVVRHTYGPSHSLLNRAVYDRQSDWLLSADQSYTSASLQN